MTDLEITCLCAEAMGLHPSPYGEDRFEVVTWHGPDGEHPTYRIYDPLHDDEQALALVKEMKLDIHYDAKGWWARELLDAQTGEYRSTFSMKLNRAICECAAKMNPAAVKAG